MRQVVLGVIAAEFPLRFLGTITLDSVALTVAALAVMAVAVAAAAIVY